MVWINCSYVLFNHYYCCPNVVCVDAFTVLILLVSIALMLFMYFMSVTCDAKNGRLWDFGMLQDYG